MDKPILPPPLASIACFCRVLPVLTEDQSAIRFEATDSARPDDPLWFVLRLSGQPGTVTVSLGFDRPNIGLEYEYLSITVSPQGLSKPEVLAIAVFVSDLPRCRMDVLVGSNLVASVPLLVIPGEAKRMVIH